MRKLFLGTPSLSYTKNKMKSLILLIFLAFEVSAQDSALTLDFKELVTAHKLGKIQDQVYCYKDSAGVQGYQPERLQRIASVTKLLTTFLASENLDLNQRFVTRFYIGKDTLHIEGTRDPYFEDDKLLLLFQALNSLGYKSFKEISFNSDFWFYDLPMESYEEVTPLMIKARLAFYTSLKNAKTIRSTWKSLRKFALEEGVTLPTSAPSVTAKKISIKNINPLRASNSVLYLHRSKPFHNILKSMNVISKNFVAENVYVLASEKKNLVTLMKEKGIDPKTFVVYNGSGLPIIAAGKRRLDNLASCETILSTITLLSESVAKHALTISDVMAVNGGKDLGSFRNRFADYPETHEAVISKTGTLKHTSSLAGYIVSKEAIPFAILNHTNSTTSARTFQDQFVSRMFHHLGEPHPINYEKISIFPWDMTEFLELAY